jgi:quercetin dioxygenase-like cupin family protein
MKITQVESCPVKPNPHGVAARLLHEDPQAIVVHLSLEPGQTIAPHEAPMNVLFFVLEGSGAALMGNESMPVSANTLIESPKGNPHGFSNTGSGPDAGQGSHQTRARYQRDSQPGIQCEGRRSSAPPRRAAVSQFA